MTINKLHPIFIQGFLDSIIDDVQDKEVSQITVGLITSYKDCVLQQ
jgi:hypothetical protein